MSSADSATVASSSSRSPSSASRQPAAVSGLHAASRRNTRNSRLPSWAIPPVARPPVGAPAYSVPVDTREAAQRWAAVWERGWREHDAAAITALYAEGAFWQQHPFHEPEPDYLARVFAEEESAQCRFGTPIVDGDQAAVPWSAQTRLADGGTEDLAGVSLLRFRADGLVVEERDFWNQG